MEASEPSAVVGELSHGLRRRTAKRRHRGVVEIDQLVPHRKMPCVSLPNRQFLYRILTNFEIHSIYNTLKSPKEAPVCVVCPPSSPLRSPAYRSMPPIRRKTTPTRSAIATSESASTSTPWRRRS